MKLLAIDPGYDRLGIAVLSEDRGHMELLFSNCFTTNPKDSFETRLQAIGEEVRRLIKKYSPEMMGIETLFFNQNVRTAMRVAEARGVIIYEAALAQLAVLEFTPPEIKLATVGSGRADKKQIISLVPRLVSIKKEIKHDDEYDAIAIGITCASLYKSRARIAKSV